MSNVSYVISKFRVVDPLPIIDTTSHKYGYIYDLSPFQILHA